jgi:hypothetical protein
MKLIFKKKERTQAKYVSKRFKNSYRCVVCESTQDLTNHHLIPKSDGGKGKLHNTIRVCRQCHDEIHGFKTRKHRLEEMISSYIIKTGNTDIQDIAEDLEIEPIDVVMITNPEYWEACMEKFQLRKLKEISKFL